MQSTFTELETESLLDEPVTLFPSHSNHGIQPLAKIAAEHLQLRLECLYPQVPSTVSGATGAEGKMFGVLVVRRGSRIGYLSAFSGKLNGSWSVDGFVPPPFNVNDMEDMLSEGEQKLETIDKNIESVKCSGQYENLLDQKKKLTRDFDRAIADLQKEHRKRKLQRRAIRLKMCSEDHLIELSRQSQYDKRQRKQLRAQHEVELGKINSNLSEINEELQTLRLQRQGLSRSLQIRYFSLFNLLRFDGQRIELCSTAVAGGTLPAAGTGECAAPKLLSFAFQKGYKPLAGTEFWWGSSPAGHVRHHGSFYPPCRSKCATLLPRMLLPEKPSISSLDVANPSKQAGISIGSFEFSAMHPEQFHNATGVEIVYEDSSMAIVNKPHGLLSVPGKSDRTSLLDWARDNWPAASGPLLVHRLDMDTSGLLVIALNPFAHKQLQKLFMERLVSKSYSALVHGWVSRKFGVADGIISLPLRVDLDDRPRQMVCEQYGKQAETHWQMLEETTLFDIPVTRLLLQPVTGRTHQLRLHMASQQGLGMPIIGDPLYAPSVVAHEISVRHVASRMMLHAEKLEFVHPLTHKPMLVQSKAPF